MESTARTPITIEATVNAPIEQVWECWNVPEHVMAWNQASDDWHCPKGENDLRPGGSFTFTMAAKDGTFSFDFGGIYDEVRTNEFISYTMGDSRKVQVKFASEGGVTKIVETFEAEAENPIELQRDGWQAILNNFKKYTESRA